MSAMRIDKTIDPQPAALARLRDNWARFVASRMPDLPDESADVPFLFEAFEAHRCVGGIYGKVYWNGLEIDILWVDEPSRGAGHGARLLAEAEAFAREQGAVVAFLKTVEARGFYERRGYRVFGVLEDRPPGTRLYHMSKRLDESG